MIKLQLIVVVISVHYTGGSGYRACLVYFERVERHTIYMDLDIRNKSLAFEKPHYTRNNFRSEIKNVIFYML